MDYKAYLAQTPHVVKYIRKSVVIGVDIEACGSIFTREIAEPGVVTKLVKCGVVVAYKDAEGISHAGWSVCSDNDSFSKVKGRAIALLRAKSGKSSTRNIPVQFIQQVRVATQEMKSLADEYLSKP